MALRANRPGMRLPMRVWDAPVRLVHWAVTLLVVLAFVSIWRGALRLHLLSGYAVLALLLFRIVWGFVGSDTARFSSMLRDPASGLRQLASIGVKEPDDRVGHNPVNGWLAIVLFILLAAQTITGLFARRAGAGSGPLAGHLGTAAGDTVTCVHTGWLVGLLLAAIALHVLFVVLLAVLKRQDLVRPMVTGKKMLPAATRAPRMRPAVMAWTIMAIAALAVWLLATRA